MRYLEQTKQPQPKTASVQDLYIETSQKKAKKRGNNKRKGFNSPKLRWSIQIAFFIVVLVIGWQFYT